MTDREYLAMEISTTVRSLKEPPWLPFVRAGHRVFSALAPEAAAARAERLFLTPPRPRRPAWEIDLLARAEARPMRVGPRRIETWTWGTGPSVLLVHGWGGRGTQLGAFVAPLVARGFSVVTFDAPGHGASDDGVVTIPEMTAAIHAAAASRGPARGPTAEAIRYALNHWNGLERFLEDGRIELDTNSVERAMRPVALSRKNSLFAGSDEGGENWACLASLIETALCRARHNGGLCRSPNYAEQARNPQVSL